METSERDRRKKGKRHIHWIQEPTIAHQLIQFLAYGDGNTVPVIAPSDVKISDELRDVTPPEGAYMGVMTSGTSGRQKVLFRPLKAGTIFFKLQNKIFKMGEKHYVYAGSLAFTGNLNFIWRSLRPAEASLRRGFFDPRLWKRMIEAEQATCVYLIPVKLRALGGVSMSGTGGQLSDYFFCQRLPEYGRCGGSAV